MYNKKIEIIIIILLFGVASILFMNNKLTNKETVLEEVKLKENKVDKNSFAIMIQKEDKTGYDVYEENTWPTEGYEFNSELSGCIDNYGSIVENSMTYNKDTNIITIDTGVTSSCYVYFDIKNNALGQYIIDNSISGLDKNFIGTDTLYRFSGTSGNTGINNYICLGEDTCTNGSDNMYRIIGVEPSSGYVKVIKQTKYDADIFWDSSETGVTWPNSEAYSTVLTWYNSVSFKDMIVEHVWNIGDVNGKSDTYMGTRDTVLDLENNTTFSAYVGILSMTDYYMAYKENQNWYNLYSNYTNNWIHLANNGNTSDYEWLITRYSNSVVWSVYNSGRIGDGYAYKKARAVRPVFYLSSAVHYVDGDGTSEDPFVVKLVEGPNVTVLLNKLNSNNILNTTLTISSNKSGTYCVNTSSIISNMSNCVFEGNITANSSITTSVFPTYGYYYVHVKDAVGNIGISNRVSVPLSQQFGEYLIQNPTTGLNTTTIYDGMYRYIGTSANNYVKLSDGTNEILYRIIGITTETNKNTNLGIEAGQLKLITAESIANYEWNTSPSNTITWENSAMYSYLRGNSVLGNVSILPSGWLDKISNVKWYIGDVNAYANASTIIGLEDDLTTTNNSQIGLMYLSDYYYAYNAGGTQNCKSIACINWLTDTSNETWTMLRHGYGDYCAWQVNMDGNIACYGLDFPFAVRPVIYLSTNVNYISGSGTSTDPFIVE